MNESVISKAVRAAIGISVMATSSAASADLLSMNWQGYFTMQDQVGVPLANPSIPLPTSKSQTNQHQTPISGTMQFDTVSGAGNMTLVPFEFLAGTTPWEADSMSLQAIGDGMGGSGTLVMGNMLFNWNGNTGMPVSIVLDASGFFASQDTGPLGAVNAFGDPWTDGVLDSSDSLIQNTGAVPASDGIYIGTNPNIQNPSLGNGPNGDPGYLALGPIPLATTAWNTSSAVGCVFSDCQGVSPSGVLPLIADPVDAAQQGYEIDYTDNTGAAAGVSGIGGSPVLDGPFLGLSINMDLVSLDNLDVTQSQSAIIMADCNVDADAHGCVVPSVPVPAAVWLFGSGLLGLIGVARRRVS